MLIWINWFVLFQFRNCVVENFDLNESIIYRIRVKEHIQTNMAEEKEMRRRVANERMKQRATKKLSATPKWHWRTPNNGHKHHKLRSVSVCVRVYYLYYFLINSILERFKATLNLYFMYENGDGWEREKPLKCENDAQWKSHLFYASPLWCISILLYEV